MEAQNPVQKYRFITIYKKSIAYEPISHKQNVPRNMHNNICCLFWLYGDRL